jgi:type I restriction enzyme, S subunit
MTSDWVKFTDLLSTIIDNRGKTCPVQPYGIPLIATNCVNGIDLYPTYDTTRFVSDETYKTWFRGHPQSGDILFVCKGSPGRTNWVPDPVDFCIAQDMVSVRANPEKVYSKYLFAALRSNLVQQQIQNMHVGTMIPHFKKGDFDKLLIPMPSKATQIEVGDLYFAISDRISVLQKINRTLEAITQALYKSWFIDFDPVQDKANGITPHGIDDVTAKLFPSSFTETPTGKIPQGWEVGDLSSFASFQNSYAFKGNSWATSGHPVIKIGNVKPLLIDISGCSFVDSSTVIGLNRFELKRGDLLVGMTGYVGETGLMPYSNISAYLNQRVGRLATHKGLDDLGFVFAAVRQPSFKSYAENHAHGSAQPNVSGSDIMKFPVIKPKAEVVERFNEILLPMLQAILNNQEKSETLISIRDTLLPRLISGQLSINDAELESKTV